MRVIVMLLIAASFTGCSSFKYYDRAKECDSLLDKSRQLNERAVVIIDSLENVNTNLEKELEDCQKQQMILKEK